MYSYIVVDDEAMIRESIPMIVNWEEKGFEWVGSATNGIDGQALIRELQPDLVVMDVRMPGKDGLTVCKELREEGYDGSIIILTAYGEFEYAQRAIRLGVDGYLLKPIDESELERLLDYTREKLDEKVNDEQLRTVSQLLSFEENLRFFLYQHQEVDLKEERLQKFFDSFVSPMTVALIPDTFTPPGGQRTEFYKHLQQFFPKRYIAYEFWSGECYLLVLHDCGSLRFRHDIETFAKKLGTTAPAVIHGHLVQHWTNLPHALDTAYFLWDQAEHFPDVTVLNLDVLTQMAPHKLQASGILEAEGLSDTYGSNRLKDPEYSITEQVHNIIKANYASNLTLEQIAEDLHYNSNYLGRRFSADFGMTFNEVLDQVRLEHAKRLLRNTKMKISDVAAQCGYTNSEYFYRKFRGFMEMTPAQYRREEQELR